MVDSSPSNTPNVNMSCNKASSPVELPEGRVKTVICRDTLNDLTYYDGEYPALNDNCPQQGGPLSEDSINTGWLRVP